MRVPRGPEAPDVLNLELQMAVSSLTCVLETELGLLKEQQELLMAEPLLP